MSVDFPEFEVDITLQVIMNPDSKEIVESEIREMSGPYGSCGLAKSRDLRDIREILHLQMPVEKPREQPEN